MLLRLREVQRSALERPFLRLQQLQLVSFLLFQSQVIQAALQQKLILSAFRSGSDALAALGDEPPSSYRRVQLPNRNNSERQPFARRAINNPGNENANRAVLGLIGRAHNARNSPMEKPLSTAEQLERHKLGTDLSKQINRRWKAGDVYAPHDLSPIEMAKWKKRGNPTVDVFDVLDLNPIDEYKVCLRF